jgi:diguanylate cyclase (GGDEF)-like protein
MSLVPGVPLLDALLQAVWLIDPQSLRIMMANRAACALIGQPAQEQLGRPVAELFCAPQDICFWDDVAHQLDDCIESETLLQSADGIVIPVARRVSHSVLEDGQAVLMLSAQDLRVQQQAQADLERLVAELRATLESTGDGILVCDAQGAIRHFNRQFVALWQVPETLLLVHDDPAIHDHLTDSVKHPVHYDKRLQEIATQPLQEATDMLELLSGRLLERVTMPQFNRGQPSGRVFSFRDVTEKVAAQQRIETLAYTDALTGLPNRLMLRQQVAFGLRMAQRSGGQFAIFFIDLDRFKNINDSLGHAQGDEVLQETAKRLKACLRDVDTLSRQGGDEFVAFLQGADVHGAEIAARRMLAAMAEPFLVAATPFSLGCSIGVALYPDDGNTLDELIRSADAAMYRVKDRGRGSFRFYQPQMNVDLLSRIKMDHAMRMALDQGHFRLHYQPQISLATGALVGVEALIRWTDAEFGPVSPGQFIPLAEESGFIVSLGNWVLHEAVRQAELWQRDGRALTVSVNVSAFQFQQTDFVERVANALRQVGLPADLLELELTESILVQDANEALERLHALAALGVTLSIDDFGTGYSSLAYLKQFPISKLKIDRSFVTGLPLDESDRAIVSATIAMAHALKLTVVAEGVETTGQQDYLASQHCESYQGFLCSPALPAAAFDQLMRDLPGGKIAHV